MWQLFILVEGPTEETFVKTVLYPYFFQHNIHVIPIIAKTKQLANGQKIKGGINTSLVIDDLRRMVHNIGPRTIITTLIDYYGLPTNFPGFASKPNGTSLAIVQHLERALAEAVGTDTLRFIPFIQLHEFETYLFCDRVGFANYIDPKEANVTELNRIVDRYPNPEDINNNPITAPSKRILAHFEGYNKAIDGSGIARQIGIEKIIEKCPHFRSWIERIITLAS
jgi:hypothetical protein